MAAVDPGAYRSFTPPKYANFQDAWDRVAGGELALKERLKGKLTTDENDYLRLGGAADAPSVHIGAYVQQQPLIDAVVNPTWVETLGMTADNALLVRTGAPRPSEGREEAREAVRRRRLGHAGRQGHPDRARSPAPRRSRWSPAPSPTRSASTATPSSAAATSRPTRPGCATHITTEVVPILGAVTCNKVVFPQLKAALQDIHDRGLDDKIHPEQFAGCYYPRFIAGTLDAVQPRLRPGPRHQRGREPARHRRPDRPRRRRDLPEVGLHLGRRLALHRPDALRAEQHPHPDARVRPQVAVEVRAAGRRWSRRAGGSGSAPPGRRPTRPRVDRRQVDQRAPVAAPRTAAAASRARHGLG